MHCTDVYVNLPIPSKTLSKAGALDTVLDPLQLMVL